MTLIVMLAALVVGAVLQASLPTLTLLGNAPVPVLAGVVLYYALIRDRAMMLTAAIAGGLIQDALGLMPLGYSAFAYCLFGLAVRSFREAVLVRQWTTHVLFGAAGNAAMHLLLATMLLINGSARPAWLWLSAKIVGALLTGAVVVPLVFHVMARIDRMVGNLELEET